MVTMQKWLRQFACIATLRERPPTSLVGRRIAACAEVAHVVVIVVVLPNPTVLTSLARRIPGCFVVCSVFPFPRFPRNCAPAGYIRRGYTPMCIHTHIHTYIHTYIHPKPFWSALRTTSICQVCFVCLDRLLFSGSCCELSLAGFVVLVSLQDRGVNRLPIN